MDVPFTEILGVVREKLEPGIAFAVNRAHERYVPGLDTESIARYIATGRGTNGDCCDYLFDTVEHLRELDIRDRRMEALERRVRELRDEAAPAGTATSAESPGTVHSGH